MSAGRPPRNTRFDGGIYGELVEPFLSGVHDFVADHLPYGRRVLDAGCGTGGLALQLAERGRVVLGVDLSPRNVAYAGRRARRMGHGHPQLVYRIGDVAQLEMPEEGPYDVATLVLALHEMPPRFRVPVLLALMRLARTVMIVDFAVPMPWNLFGVRNRMAELVAGGAHWAGFRDYVRQGGLRPLLDETGANVQAEHVLSGGTMTAVVIDGAAATAA